MCTTTRPPHPRTRFTLVGGTLNSTDSKCAIFVFGCFRFTQPFFPAGGAMSIFVLSFCVRFVLFFVCVYCLFLVFFSFRGFPHWLADRLYANTILCNTFLYFHILFICFLLEYLVLCSRRNAITATKLHNSRRADHTPTVYMI